MSDAADQKMIPASSERSAAQTNTAETYHPTRRCEGCGERRPKHELLRAVKDADGNLSLDISCKAQSRGAYICRSESCLKKALKNGRMARRLTAQTTDEFRESVTRMLENNE